MVAEPAPTIPAFSIRRSDRARRSRLTITDEGAAVVVLPLRAAEREAGELVQRHWRWIVGQQRRISARRAQLAARASVDVGRIFSVGGVGWFVRITDERERARVDAWLRREARTAITSRVEALAPVLGVTPNRITIRDQRTRWGSASRTGTLSFSWRLVLCPPEILEYVVVHELAHLRVAGHRPRFWHLVEQHFGDARPPRRWLREHELEIRHALD